MTPARARRRDSTPGRGVARADEGGEASRNHGGPMVSMRVRTVSRSSALALLPGQGAVTDSAHGAAMFGEAPPGYRLRQHRLQTPKGTPAAMETHQGAAGCDGLIWPQDTGDDVGLEAHDEDVAA